MIILIDTEKSSDKTIQYPFMVETLNKLKEDFPQPL